MKYQKFFVAEGLEKTDLGTAVIIIDSMLRMEMVVEHAEYVKEVRDRLAAADKNGKIALIPVYDK